MTKLTEKEEAFARAYVDLPPEGRSAVKAFKASRDTRGMKPATMAANARKLLRKPKIQARIKELDDGPSTPEVSSTPQSTRPRALRPQEEDFCQAYARLQNGLDALDESFPETRTQAGRTRSDKAYYLLKDSAVQARVRELEERIRVVADRRFDITIETVLEELARLGFGNLADFIDESGQLLPNLSKLSRAKLAAVAQVTGAAPNRPPSLKLHEKRGALETLLKYLGGFALDNKQKGKAMGEAIGEAVERKPLSDLEYGRLVAFTLFKATRASAEERASARSNEEVDEILAAKRRTKNAS